jgi:hypothetical protein
MMIHGVEVSTAIAIRKRLKQGLAFGVDGDNLIFQPGTVRVHGLEPTQVSFPRRSRCLCVSLSKIPIRVREAMSISQGVIVHVRGVQPVHLIG